MNSLQKFPIFSGIFFLVGLFFINDGIGIIRGKKFLVVSRYTRPEHWHKPYLLTGNKAIFQGVLYIVAGILFMLGAIGAYLHGD